VPNEVALRCNTSCIQSRRQGRDIAHFHAQKPHPQRHCHRHARHEGASNASFQGFASLKSTIQAESIPLLQLFLALGERCTDDATERARNGERDRDRGRPVLLVRPVRVVAVTSSILAILDFFFVAASETAYVW
jgi:hypothetical protein